MSALAAELESLEPEQARCFAASCATHFAPAWSRWPEANDLPFLTATEDLLWTTVDKPDIARLKRAEKTLKQIPIFLDHYTDNPTVLITKKGLLVMGYALLVAQNPADQQSLRHLHFTCCGLCGELGACTTPRNFGGRKTRAVRARDVLALERGELERQAALLGKLRAARDLKKFAQGLRARIADDPQRALLIQALEQIPA